MANNKYKKITDLGLNIYTEVTGIYVSADQLLEVLNKGVEVKGYIVNSNIEHEWCFGEKSSKFDTHSGLVIGIKELKPKEVTITREKLKDALYASGNASEYDLNNLYEELGL